MRDVARAAGVSRMTVSRALKADSPVSEETRHRIQTLVREMNYVPDQTAGSLSTQRSGFVALLVPSLNNLHFAETVQALTSELEGIGRQVLLGYTGYSAEREEQLVEDMLRRRPEAIVLSYDGHSDRTVRLLSEANIPVIEAWERPEDPIDHTIGFSNFEASREMALALIDRGYSQIAFLGEAQDDWTRGAARRRGFIAAMQERGLEANRILRTGKPPLSIEDGADAVQDILNRFPDTQCIFCVSDVAAFGVLSRLQALGLDVPGDVGVAGFGNFEVSRFASPTLTTVEVDPRGIGRAAGALIAELLTSEPAADEGQRRIDIAVTPVFRGSTR